MNRSPEGPRSRQWRPFKIVKTAVVVSVAGFLLFKLTESVQSARNAARSAGTI
jgi:hypothetical protein